MSDDLIQITMSIVVGTVFAGALMLIGVDYSFAVCTGYLLGFLVK